MRRDLNGIFNIGWGASIKKISDGTSKTIAMGEASSDTRWRVCQWYWLHRPDAVAGTGSGEIPVGALGFPWIAGQPNSTNTTVNSGP